MIELQFVRMILHLIAATAFAMLATMGDWRKSYTSVLYAGVALYFTGAAVRLFLVTIKLPTSTISDYWLTPVLALVVVAAWWAAYKCSRHC